MTDRWGITRESAIRDSRVREVFTPHQPVNEVELLFGRDDEVSRILQNLNTPGQHALLYGERGVGKSSLANVMVEVLAPVYNEHVFIKRCDSTDTFETILEEPLNVVGVDLLLDERTETEGKNRSAGGSVKVVRGDVGSDSSISHRFRRPAEISPAKAVSYVGGLNGLLVIDEADAISDPEDRRKLAEFVKMLSDSGSKLKVFLVGIAETAADLTAGHPSVGRCLAETELKRLSEGELREIIHGGASRVGLQFEDDAAEAIVACSARYPHFTHLLALKCAENAVVNSKPIITRADVDAALAAARRDAEGTLKLSYDGAIRSYSTDMYKVILESAAALDTAEFTAEQLRDSIEKRNGVPLSQNSLNNYFQRLISEDGSTILRRMAKGVYRFTDPRMPSYVRIASGHLE